MLGASNETLTLNVTRLTNRLFFLDAPEIMPGEVMDTPDKVVSVPPSSSTTAVPKSTVKSSGSSGASKQGAIAGGLVWGVTTMVAISGLVFTLIPQLV
jgi:hypothetical protein